MSLDFSLSSTGTPTPPEIDFPVINLLEDFEIGESPSFSVVSMEEYISTLSTNSTAARISLLPPYFILSLSFRPNTNTAIRLISSLQSTPVVSDHDSSSLPLLPETDPFDNLENGQPSTEEHEYASLLLSNAATYLYQDSYFTLWDNVTSTQRHSLQFIVANGSISTCLDGDFRPANPGVLFWEDISGDNNTLRFSSYLHSMNSLVSAVICGQVDIVFGGVWFFISCFYVFQGVLCGARIQPFHESQPISSDMCGMLQQACHEVSLKL